MPDGTDFAMDQMRETIVSIKQRLTQYRKKGLDTSVIDMRLAFIPPKIKMIEVTRDGKDIQRTNAILDLAKKDADDLEAEYQAVLSYKKPQEPDPATEEIDYLIEQGRKAAAKSGTAEAKAFYLRAFKEYNSLKDEQKKRVIGNLGQFRAELTK
jgi:hypothetical protein